MQEKNNHSACLKILGTGIYKPKRKVSSAQISQNLGLPENWVERKIGIKERLFIQDETASFMGAEALKSALKNANLQPENLDLLICANGTFEQPIPCTAVLIHGQFAGLKGKPAFDINSTCLSFLAALDLCASAIANKKFKTIAIVSSEIASVGLNPKEKESYCLMGDGAAAVIISACPEHKGLINSKMQTYSEGSNLAQIEGGGTKLPATNFNLNNQEKFLFSMQGPQIFKLALKYLPNFVEELLQEASIFNINDLDLIIPHQASPAALELIRQKLKIEKNKFFLIIQEYGNQIAASIPFALHLAIESGRIKRDNNIMLLGTSAGFSIGGIILKY